jgi:hypothetical protein
MKPQSLQTRDRLQERQEKALRSIIEERDRESRNECVFMSFGATSLNETDTLQRYDRMLEGMIGKQ